MATITTIHGPMDESQLVKCDGLYEDDNERTTWVEYRLPGSDEIVHRSAHVFLKKALLTEAMIASLS
jgi:hypothetical protein